MKTIFIQEKLKELGIDLSEVALGDFDFIGEYSAKKMRERESELYRTVGYFFRPNYERGILIYSLIKKFNLNSYLEIGFGRGYSAICAAKALHDNNSPGIVTTIDPNLDEKQMQLLNSTIPGEWLRKIKFLRGTSQQCLPTLQEKYDLVYVDGDHTAQAVASDWEGVRDKWNAFCLFDDYHLPTKTDSKAAGIECAEVIDRIDYPKKELIIMDRRIFFDDRRIPDDKIDYGQVLLTNEQFLTTRPTQQEAEWRWNWE